MSTAQPAPADRRTFLGGSLALASAVAATAAPPALAAVPAEHADVELLRLALAAVASEQRLDGLANHHCDVREERFREPPIPDALMRRLPDDAKAGISIASCDVRHIDGVRRYLYILPETLRDLRQELAEQEARGEHNSFYGAGRVERLREIAAAGDAWTIEWQRAWQAAGLADLDRAYEAEREARDALIHSVAATPARTAEGVAAKMRVIARFSGRSMRHIEAKGLPELLARADRGEDDDEEMLLLSAMLDAVKLAAPLAPGEMT